VLARAAVAAGVDASFWRSTTIRHARSDGANALRLDKLKGVLEELLAVQAPSQANETGRMTAACSKHAAESIHPSALELVESMLVDQRRNILRAKAHILCACYGTTKVVPFQNPVYANQHPVYANQHPVYANQHQFMQTSATG